MKAVNLRTNHQFCPLIDGNPEFSWRMESEDNNVMQVDYRIRVKLKEEILWDSGKVQSAEQSFISYEGKPFQKGTEYTWVLEITDNYANRDIASATFETALLLAEDWNAEWIESKMMRTESQEYVYGSQPPPVFFMRKFFLKDTVIKARLYATAYGVYRTFINDVRPDDREFAPEHTVYRNIMYYQTYNVTNLLHLGNNMISFYVGDGWYHCPQTKPITERSILKPSLLYQLEIEYENGTRETISSDGSELSGKGPVIFSDIFRGEKQDANQTIKCVFPVKIVEHGFANLLAQPMPPVRPINLIEATRVYTSPKGENIVDFGQVICGRARIRINLPKGTETVFEYFEIPDSEGNYLNTMYADQKDIYISDGQECEYEAMFTFHGFRYIKVSGMRDVKIKDFTAVVLTTEKDNVGSFECSDEKLNCLYRNIRASQTANMMSIPTDCPTREKAGFTGDIQIYCKTALLNEDMTPFLTGWLLNLAADQAANGVVPMVVPFTKLYEALTKKVCDDFGDTEMTGIAGWGDAAVLVPYTMYWVTGNRRILADFYAVAKAWCDYIIKTAENKRGDNDLPEKIDKRLWNTGFHFGEWLIPSQKNVGGNFEICKQSSVYIAPLFGYLSVKRMAEISEALEKEDDFRYYSEIASEMKNAIQSGLMKGGHMPIENMGAYVLAIAFDIVPTEEMPVFSQKLISLLESNGNRLDTGFLATPYLLDALDKIGRRDLAVKLLWQNKSPSWLYEVEQGATTIWEDWTAVAEDGTPKITSYNHYAFGCVDDWICRAICGIDSGAPGFRHIMINPCTAVPLTWFKRSFICEAGKISVQCSDESLEVTIPCNVTATVIWKGNTYNVGSGNYRF